MIWARVKRVATSLFALSAAGGLGWLIADEIIEFFGEKVSPADIYDLGTMLAICGILLLFVKDLLLALLKTWNYIWEGNETSHPKTGETIVWLMEATAVAAILVFVFSIPPRDCPKDWTTCVASAGRLTPTCFRTCMRNREVDHLTAQITQVKDEIRLRLNAVDAALASLAGSLVGFRDGVVDDVTTRVGHLISTHDTKTATTLKGIKKLLAGCTLTSADECPTPPCPPPTGDNCPEQPPPVEAKPRYTLLYENARLDEDGKVTGDSFGVKLERRHLHRLNLLTSALKSCLQAGVAVEFEVTGHSSTAEFRFQPNGDVMLGSAELNLETANLRGQLVGAYLKEKGFVVHWEPWSSEADLSRPYQGAEQQALNRTVFIDVKNAAACDFPR